MALSPLFEIYDPAGILTEDARLGRLVDEEGRRRKAQLSDLMPEEERSNLMRELANRGSSALAGLGWALDVPGAFARGTISGAMDGDYLRGFRTALAPMDQRVTGRDLLRQMNLVGDEDNWWNWGAGLAGEIVLDPLTYANPLSILGRGAYSAAGRTAARAGLLENAALLGRQNDQGIREFLRSNTARDLLAGMPEQAADDFARAAAGRGLQVDDLLDQPLAGAMGLRIPGTEIGTTLSGGALGDIAARGLDRFGEGLKRFPLTAPVVNRLRRNFDPSVMERLDPDDQWRAREAFAEFTANQRDMREALGTQLDLASRADVARLPEELRDFNSPRIQNAIRDTIEAQIDPERMAQLVDQDAVRAIDSVPEWRNYRSWYRQALYDSQQRRAALGLQTPTAQSLYGTGFAPRQAQRFAVQDLPVIGDRPDRRAVRYDRGQRVYTVDDLVGRGRREYTDLERPAETMRRLMTGDFGTNLRDRLRTVGDADLPDILDEAFTSLGLETPYQRIQTADGQTMQSLRDFLSDTSLSDVKRAPAERALQGLEAQARSMKTQLGDLLRQADNQFATQGRGLFDQHTAADFLRYGVGGARSEANAQVVVDSLINAASDIPADAVPGGGARNLLDAARDMGFDRGALREILMDRLPGRDIDQLSVSDRALAELQAISPARAQDPTSPLGKAWRSFTSAFKVGALANPAYHFRNLYSGGLAALSAGELNPLSYVRSAAAGFQAGRGNMRGVINRLRNAPGFEGLTDEEILAQFQRGASRNPLGQGLLSEGDAGLASQPEGLLVGASQPRVDPLYQRGRGWLDWLNRFTTVRGVDFGVDRLFGGTQPWTTRSAPAETLNPLLQWHELAGRRVEDANRLGTYIEMLRQGASPDAAANMVYKTQIDYSPRAFTEFERKLKQYVPFYSYTKGIAPLIAENLLYRPGGVQGQVTRAMASASQPREGYFTPEHLRDTLSIPLPGEYGKEGNLRRYVTNIDVPWETLNLIDTGVGNTAVERALSAIQNTGLNLAGQVNPIIKAPLELLMNRQLYSGREMSDLYSWLDERGVPQGRILEQIATNLPGGSKLNALARTAADTRMTTAEKATKLLVNNLLGIKVTDIDQDKAADFAARNMMTTLLRSAPGVRAYENLAVPEEDLLAMPEEQRRMYLAYRILQSEAAQRARQRRQAEMDPLSAMGL